MHDEFHRGIYISLGIIFGSILLFGTSFYFLADDIALQSKEIAGSRGLVRQSAEASTLLAEVKQNLPKVQRYKTIMDRLVPNQLKLLDLPRTLDNAARLQKVNLLFTPGNGQTEPQEGVAGTIPFSITVSGPLQNVLQFMNYIESASQDFLISLDSFDVKRVDPTTYEVMAPGRAFFK